MPASLAPPDLPRCWGRADTPLSPRPAPPQGDLYQWVGLLNHFEAFFDEYVKPRQDLQLKFEGDAKDPEFPTQNCLEVLKATAVILENCSNKHAYNSFEVRVRFMPRACARRRRLPR